MLLFCCAASVSSSCVQLIAKVRHQSLVTVDFYFFISILPFHNSVSDLRSVRYFVHPASAVYTASFISSSPIFAGSERIFQ